MTYDNDVMRDNIAWFEEKVVGHKIVNVEKKSDRDGSWNRRSWTEVTLDNGTCVELIDTGDCCAYTELEAFLLNPDKIDHVITGVTSSDDYTTWHVYADMGDVLELTVGWSEGSGYYGYGFDIRTKELGVT